MRSQRKSDCRIFDKPLELDCCLLDAGLRCPSRWSVGKLSARRVLPRLLIETVQNRCEACGVDVPPVADLNGWQQTLSAEISYMNGMLMQLGGCVLGCHRGTVLLGQSCCKHHFPFDSVSFDTSLPCRSQLAAFSITQRAGRSSRVLLTVWFRVGRTVLFNFQVACGCS